MKPSMLANPIRRRPLGPTSWTWINSRRHRRRHVSEQRPDYERGRHRRPELYGHSPEVGIGYVAPLPDPDRIEA